MSETLCGHADVSRQGHGGVLGYHRRLRDPYNLLILRRVTSDTRLAELKTLFAQYWQQGWGDSGPESILREIFASPQVEAILAGILSVTGEPGCLVIVKNYSGDRLNFGLAVERAKSLGKNVAMDLCQAMSDVLAGSMGGSSGVLLSIFLTSIGRAYAQTGAWPKALESGIASLQTYGGAAVGDRTMIDALVPANKALLAAEGLPRAAEMARAGAEATAKMDRAGAGRSSYLSARSPTDLPDPGAVAVAEVFAALAAVH